MSVGLYKTDSVVWVKSAGRDQWGEPLTPTEETIRVRLERKTRLVRDRAGEQVVSSATILIDQQPSHEDRFRFDGIDHAVLEIDEEKSFAVSHYRVYVT